MKSIVSRLMVAMALLMGVATFILTYFISINSERELLHKTIESFEALTLEDAEELRSVVDRLVGNSLLLADTPPVRSLYAPGANAPQIMRDNAWKQRQSQLMEAMLKVNTHYQEIRLISLQEDIYQHQIVVKNHQGRVFVEMDPRPQVHELTIRDLDLPPVLERGQVYFSYIHLQREGGEIVYPKVPQLYATTGLIINGKVVGLIVVTKDVSRIFHSISSNAPLEVEKYIVNYVGQYLMHPDKSKEFAFEFGMGEIVGANFPIITDFLKEHAHLQFTEILNQSGKRRLIHARKFIFNPKNDSQFLVLIQSVPYQTIMAAPHKLRIYSYAIGFSFLVLGVVLIWWLTKVFMDPLKSLTTSIQEFARGTTHVKLPTANSTEAALLVESFNQMAQNRQQRELELRESTAELKWLRDSTVKLNDNIRGEMNPTSLASAILNHMSQLFELHSGVVYYRNDQQGFAFAAAYAMSEELGPEENLPEGILRQAIEDQQIKHLRNLPSSYFKVKSGLGEDVPGEIVVVPLIFDMRCNAVMELASFIPFDELGLAFLESCQQSLGITFNVAISRQRLQGLLSETQAQSEELQTQQEELRTANEELEQKSLELRTQQEELETTNEELEQQRLELEIANHQLEEAMKTAEIKTRQLEESGRYKSEFLANMSHELRTPLNSILILAKILGDNENQNLQPDQVEAAKTIWHSGQDLLNLINDILDLSKVEAGKLELSLQSVDIAGLFAKLQRTFEEQARSKGLDFKFQIAADTPESIVSDAKRLEQILRNFLSNSIKFTQQGSVVVKAIPAAKLIEEYKLNLDKSMVAFSVKDTGIGIPSEKIDVIFEAFRQVDGSIGRRFGGTGLGLSISLHMAHRLGGHIHVISQQDLGSEFILFIPLEIHEGEEKVQTLVKKNNVAFSHPDQVQAEDKERLNRDEKLILIIEDDPVFARILADQCEKSGIKCVIENSGLQGVLSAKKLLPTGIILDLLLPDLHGFKVMERLKADPQTRQIPIHVMSIDEREAEAMRSGAEGFMLKPVRKDDLLQVLQKISGTKHLSNKKVLLVSSQGGESTQIEHALLKENIKLQVSQDLNQVEALLKQQKFDCVILDLDQDVDQAYQFLSQCREICHQSPVLIYADKQLTTDQRLKLEQLSRAVIIKGEKSAERLLEEVWQFLNHSEDLNQKTEKKVLGTDSALEGKVVLLVDDDKRNVYALEQLLQSKHMKVLTAFNGREALEQLIAQPADIVLMDVMMPEMDGLEAIGRIRKMGMETLPIIALTAKAMKGDREKCIEAGANDYLSKPVDTDRLINVLRIWLSRRA